MDIKTTLDSGLISSEKVTSKMETDFIDNSFGTSSICLNSPTGTIDPNQYNASINCQLVSLNEVQLMDSMLSELNINNENNGEIGNQLIPEGIVKLLNIQNKKNNIYFR